jgi:aspartyl/glutamyl-tRNA(Asn/Gln) amidotransferase C subunit
MKDDINIEKLAELARLDLADTDTAELSENIASILDYVASVEAVAASGEDTQAIGPVYNVLRADVDAHEPGAYREALLREAPAVDEEGFIIVPPIL